MADKLSTYRSGSMPTPSAQRIWPLYGAGFENLGADGDMICVDLAEPGADELFVRHDAVGICFSDVKVIRAGESHPRIYRDISKEPVVLGHEVSLTVVGVGAALKDNYAVGDRFVVQADIYVDGVGYAYGYEIQGGFSEYNIIDQRVLNGDEGNYLIRVQAETGYAEAALNEPWACIEASYTVSYRSQWREGGVLWITGDGNGVELGLAASWKPRAMVLDVTDDAFRATMTAWADRAGVDLVADSPDHQFDDVVVLGNDPERIEAASARLANDGVFTVVTNQPVPRRVSLDIGRLHYDNLCVVGTSSPDLSQAYTPIRAQLKAVGSCWILGAAGPMGHMHLQRAIEIEARPARIVATNRNPERMASTVDKFVPAAAKADIELRCLSENNYPDSATFKTALASTTADRGFDDIVVMALSTKAIEEAMDHLGPGAVMNVFAGLPRGTRANFDYNQIVFDGVRFTGTSGSSIADLQHMLRLTESHALSTNNAVAAVAGLEGVAAGLEAVAEGRFAGKVVIYPHIGVLPLTPLEALCDLHPTVYDRLGEGQTWTNEAEDELLNRLLP